MGLLDSLSNGADPGAGLLAFLNSLQQGAPASQMGPLPSDTAQYGGMPAAQAPVFAQQNAQPSPVAPVAPSQANAQMPQQPPAVIPAQSPIQPAPVAPQAPGIGDHLMAGYENLRHGGGLIGSTIAALTGQRNDTQGVQLQQQAQMQNLTFKALTAKGVDPQIAAAAIAPGNTEFLKALVTQTFGPQTVQNLGSGYVADKNGNVRRAYEPDDVNQVVQIGESPMGGKQYGIFNKGDGTIKPYTAPGDSAQGGLGDPSKTGADYLATVPKQQQGILQGMVDGTIQPPSSFALSKPYWQTMLAGAKNLDTNFDANTWAKRHKMSTDIAASGNSSMGGILANGKSSFEHLREVSDRLADLGNTSHDFPGGGLLSTAQNYAGNVIAPSSATKAKLAGAYDALGKYGAESTKFYAGTGGSAEERLAAQKNVHLETASGEEQASYLQTEKSLMLDRLRQKEDQMRDIMGDAFLQRHPVFTPQLQQTINMIDTNIAKLRGVSAPVATLSGATPKPGVYTWSPDKGLAAQ